jgi:hypothetical protein
MEKEENKTTYTVTLLIEKHTEGYGYELLDRYQDSVGKTDEFADEETVAKELSDIVQLLRDNGY